MPPWGAWQGFVLGLTTCWHARHTKWQVQVPYDGPVMYWEAACAHVVVHLACIEGTFSADTPN